MPERARWEITIAERQSAAREMWQVGSRPSARCVLTTVHRHERCPAELKVLAEGGGGPWRGEV